MRFFFLTALWMGWIINLSASEQQTRSEHPARGLLIFLDEKEKEEVGALTGELFTAIAQKAGPILASTSVLKNVFSEYGKNINDPSYEKVFKSIINTPPEAQSKALLKIFKDLELFMVYRHRKAAYKYILLKASHFNPQEWIIKKVNDFLYLLIPMSYLQKVHIDIFDVLQDNAQSVSNTELQLGLHVNHMKTSRIEDILQTPDLTFDHNYVIPALYDDALQTSTIFCVRSEYRNQQIPMPAWTILLTGHGYSGLKVASLSQDNFKKILDFLEHKILCRLFVYDSCFSAGITIQAVYHDITSNLQKTYSFPIIINALTDAATFANISTVQEDSNHNLTLITDGDYSLAQFLDAASQPEITNYIEIIKHIFKLGSHIKPNNAPQIKMPGLEWFSILDTENVVGIGHILATSRNHNLPLNIKTFFKKDPRIILLYAFNVPFELQLNNNIKAIVSMIPGDGVHILRSVSSTTDSVDTIIKTFMKIEALNTKKLFFIKEIQGTDKIVHNVLVTYTTIPGGPNQDDAYSRLAYYIHNNQLWVKDGQQINPQKATRQDMQLYQNYVQSITGTPQYIEQAIYQDKVEWGEPHLKLSGAFPLSQRAIIKSITTDNTTLLHDIFYSIIWMQPVHAITLVQQVHGKLLSNNSPVLLTNVIIDKDKNEILYTLNHKFYNENNVEMPNNYMPYYETLLTPPPLFAAMHKGSLLPTNIKPKGIERLNKWALAKKLAPSKSLKRKRTDDDDNNTSLYP